MQDFENAQNMFSEIDAPTKGPTEAHKSYWGTEVIQQESRGILI